MSKRIHEDKLLHYRTKLRKLQRRGKTSLCFRGPPIFSDSTYSESDQNSNAAVEIDEQSPVRVGAASTTGSGVAVVAACSPSASSLIPTVNLAVSAVPLDSEVLKALGADSENDPVYGLQIHDNLSQLWSPLLKNGLPKSDKEKLSNKYLVPGNCKLLQAPKLNLEISAAVTENARAHDQKIVTAQQQLGKGITAINRALDVLFIRDANCVIEAIKYLSDACRLLCDLHYVETQTRIKLITPYLERSFLNIIKDTPRDETLFGSNLAEKIKSSNITEKQSQIRTTTTTAAPTASTSYSMQSRGTWPATPRYPARKGFWGAKKVPCPQSPTTQPLSITTRRASP